MDDADRPTPLQVGSRYSAQAREAERRGHFAQALDKHTRAQAQFREALLSARHPKSKEILQLLLRSHERSALLIRQYLDRGLIVAEPQVVQPPEPPSTMVPLADFLESIDRLAADLVADLAAILGAPGPAMRPASPQAKGDDLGNVGAVAIHEDFFGAPAPEATSAGADLQSKFVTCANRIRQFQGRIQDRIGNARVSESEASSVRAENERLRAAVADAQQRAERLQARLNEEVEKNAALTAACDEQTKLVEKYALQWQQLKERARMRKKPIG
ncbi:unnamed protein product (mitochondrion) [Plasmodiophora brassicae]|uniref:Uncharacterized protein n=1 Tax=Plasmodiophora brassicae TaxID=37360 RepID=A0A0G4ISF5_PLABS|nr:hypothetical protein PBRA_006387 [Plasmodiophora brassicae]SPQ95153.1 unnamed protein product [Plasmodiophora brassicae]